MALGRALQFLPERQGIPLRKGIEMNCKIKKTNRITKENTADYTVALLEVSGLELAAKDSNGMI